MAAIAMVLTVSCDKEQLAKEKHPKNSSITFGGLNAKVPENHSANELEMNVSDYKSILTSSSSKLKSLKVLDYYSIVTLDSLSKLVLANYPRIDSIEYDKIRQEFTDMSDEEINKNISIIDSFYTYFIKYDLIKEVANCSIESFQLKSNSNLKSIKSTQYEDYFGTGLNQNEFWVMVDNPRLIKGVKRATENAINYTNQYFSGWSQYQDKADALRHAIWNAFLAKEAGSYRNWSYQCNDFAQQFTYAHEIGGIKPDNMSDEEYYLDQEMDLHNNSIGRIYFYAASNSHKSCALCNRHVDSPSESDMAQSIYSTYIPGAVFVSTKSQIDSYPLNLVHIK